MTKPSAEDFIQWTHPTDAELVGHVSSQEEFEELREDVTSERQEWLMKLFRGRIAELQGQKTHEEAGTLPEIDFEAIPLRPVLTYDQLKMLIDMERITEWEHMGKSQQLRLWQTMAEFEATRQGFSILGSKYIGQDSANEIAIDENEFARRLKVSQFLTNSGFPVRVLTDGVPYVMSGALDLESVQKWLDTRNEAVDYPKVYHTPWGYWQTVIAAKRAWDKDMGNATYADVVDTLDEGVFFAPYLPEELVKSGRFITLDSVARSLTYHGQRHKASTTQTFRLLIGHSTEDEVLAGHLVRLTNFNSQPSYTKSGVLFFDAAKLPSILEKIYAEDARGPKTRLFASYVLKDYFSHLVVTEEDREDESLLFGRDIPEGTFVPSYRSLVETPDPRLSMPIHYPATTPITDQQEVTPEPPAEQEVPAEKPKAVLGWMDQPTPPENASFFMLMEHFERHLQEVGHMRTEHLKVQHELIDEHYETKIALIKAEFELRRLQIEKGQLEFENEQAKVRSRIVHQALTRFLSPEQMRYLRILGYRPEEE